MAWAAPRTVPAVLKRIGGGGTVSDFWLCDCRQLFGIAAEEHHVGALRVSGPASGRVPGARPWTFRNPLAETSMSYGGRCSWHGSMLHDFALPHCLAVLAVGSILQEGAMWNFYMLKPFFCAFSACGISTVPR